MAKTIGASASVSVFPMNIQDWFPLGLTVTISLLSKGFLRVFSNTTVPKHQFFHAQLSYSPTLHPYMTTGNTIALTIQTLVNRVMTSIFNMLSRLVMAFLPRNKRLLISWLQPIFLVILEPKKIKSVTVCIVSPSIKVHPMKWWDWVSWSSKLNVEFEASFFTLLFHFHQEIL